MINKGLFTSNTDLWSTPQDFFNKLNEEFNFTLDPCATKENAKCKKFFTQEDDGLTKSWDNEIVFCNPPYGTVIKDWIKKASEARGGGRCSSCSFSNRYSILSQLHISQGGDSFSQRSSQVRRQQELCSVSFNGGNI